MIALNTGWWYDPVLNRLRALQNLVPVLNGPRDHLVPVSNVTGTNGLG